MTTAHRDPPRGAACPPWCVADHDEQQHEDDRWHTSAPMWLSVVELVTVWRAIGATRFDAVGIEMTIGIEQRVDGNEPYIHFGVSDERERKFRLSFESARRLTVALSAALHAE